MSKLLAATISLAAALAAPAAIAGDRPVVLELFTSQSCSSCPPADALLEELNRTRTDVLALDMHVTYWDHLGWKDRYSLDEATARQRSYARTLGDDQVYTPELVIDGRRGIVGSSRSQALAAISAAQRAHDPGVAVTIAGSDKLRIEAGAGQGRATVWLVGFDPKHVTEVGGGENGGRTLTEVNVVRSLQPVGDWHGAALKLIVDRPAGARVAVLLQAEDGHYLGATIEPLVSGS